MTSQGSPVARFQRALKTRNLNIIRAAAAELPHVSLPDALQVCLVVQGSAPERFDAAAVRWIGRFCAECPAVTLEHVDAAVTAFAEMRRHPEAGLARLQALWEAARPRLYP